MEEKTNQQETETEKSLPESIYIKLPGEIFDKSREFREGENFQFTYKAEFGHLWVYHQTKPGIFEYDFETDLPGFLPVSCCAAEWDIANNKPFYIQRRMVEISSVQRRNGVMRAIIKITSNEIRYFAVGCVFAF